MNTMLFEVLDASIFDEKDAPEIYFKPKSRKSFYPFNLLSLSLSQKCSRRPLPVVGTFSMFYGIGYCISSRLLV